MFQDWNKCGLYFGPVCGKRYSYGRQIPAELFWFQNSRRIRHRQNRKPPVMSMEARWM